jgi:hypothetical protein
VDPFHAPLEAATRLNAEGKVLYRQGRWDEARKKYRDAEAADPDFLAPALNVACSLVRQERFADAVTEVLRLLDRAYLPWSDEVISAADLGALKVRAEGKPVRAALASGRLRWAEGLIDEIIFVARVRPPLKLGSPAAAEETLVLGPRQEVFAWSPRTRRYRQLTSEEGRVLAVARTADRRRIAYLTAEKLIRAPGTEAALRGVVIKELELTTLAPVGRASISEDVRRLDILSMGAGFAYRIHRGSGEAGEATFSFSTTGRFGPAAAFRTARPAVTLTGGGVIALVPASQQLAGGCAGIARDAMAKDGVATIEIRGKGSSISDRTVGPLNIGGPFGAGLAGLPLR